jgi:Trk-type K+ transport system membrane component
MSKLKKNKYPSPEVYDHILKDYRKQYPRAFWYFTISMLIVLLCFIGIILIEVL